MPKTEVQESERGRAAGPHANSLLDHGADGIGRRRLLDRFTVQLPLVVLAVLALQGALVGLFFDGSVGEPTTLGTVAATTVANVAAILIFRQIRRVPGSRRLAFLLPAFALAYAPLVAAVLFFRLPYSVSLGLTGLAFGFGLTSVFNGLRGARPRSPILAVPGKETLLFANEVPGLDVRPLKSPAELENVSDATIVADLRDDLSAEWERSIAHAAIGGTPVLHVKQLRESITGKVRIDHISENSFGTLVPSLSYLLLKRGIDFLVSLIGLLILAVPMLIVAAAIRLTSRGPAIFRHKRVGYRGRVFETLKFRTMAWRLQDDGDLKTQMTGKADARITPLGRILRKTRLDELPQLLNVLRGEMSLIGPRPEALALSRWYGEHLDFYEYRHIVRPGITGWAQVNQGHVTELDDVFVKLQYDFYYIKNLSGWLDLLIAMRTVAVMMSFRGAV